MRYDRCCAYFSSSVLAAAASGFGAFIQRILDGAITTKPALRLLVNEELAEPDVRALLDGGDEAPLIDTLLARLPPRIPGACLASEDSRTGDGASGNAESLLQFHP